MKSFNVDWEKTFANIKFLLNGRTYIGCFSEAFSLSVRSVQHKLSSNNKSGLSVGELAIIARYLGCDILDLVVFETDAFVAPDEEALKMVIPEHPSASDVAGAIQTKEEKYMNYPIRNLYEFLLYLPLIEEDNLRDVVFRSYGNLNVDMRHYLLNQLSYLYREIPDTPQKAFADFCRDHDLRVKGDNPRLFSSVEGAAEYWSNLLRYREGMMPK